MYFGSKSRIKRHDSDSQEAHDRGMYERLVSILEAGWDASGHDAVLVDTACAFPSSREYAFGVMGERMIPREQYDAILYLRRSGPLVASAASKMKKD